MNERDAKQPVVCPQCGGTYTGTKDTGLSMCFKCGVFWGWGAAADDSEQPRLENETRVRVQRAGSEAYLADDVSVGRLVRWINDTHLDAAKESPPNLDYMRTMQRLGDAAEHALALYRLSTQPQNDCVSDGPADAHKSTRSAEGPFAARKG